MNFKKMVIKTKDTLYLVKVKSNYLASYKGTYSNEQSLNFVIPIMVILFLGIIYVMTQRSGSGFVSFILIGGAAITMFYWVHVLKKMTKEQKPVYNAREQETKNWVYDLIKGEGDFVFVAEVPGPEDKIAVRLIDGILYIRGSMGFSKEVPIEGSNEMQIIDFKYRNGVLTLRIK
jgi:HSP20 family molecular chaperone IbpA